MPTLEQLGPRGGRHPLAPQMRVGRDATCDIRLEPEEVSRHHAILRWSAVGWELIDGGSTNGTSLNGVRLRGGEPELIADGSVMAFGTDRCTFRLCGDGPPPPAARSGAELLVGEGQALVLPGGLSIERDGRNRWVARLADVSIHVKNWAEIEAGGRHWTLELPDETRTARRVVEEVGSVDLFLTLSRDEEHCEVSLVSEGRRTHLEWSRYNEVFLALGRAWLEDRDQPAEERGWREVEELCRAYRFKRRWLNVAVSRLRKGARARGLILEIFERRDDKIRGAFRTVELRASSMESQEKTSCEDT